MEIVYSKMTDDELRVAVANAAGWTCVTRLEGGLIGFESNTPDAKLRDVASVPDYPRDLNAAWGLFEVIRDLNCDAALESCGSAYRVYAMGIVEGPMAETPARAICLAYLELAEGAPDA